MASSRTLLRPGYGTQPVDGRSRRQEEPVLATTRYDAPTSTGANRLELPAAQMIRVRGGAAHSGIRLDVGRSEIRA